MVVYLYCVLCAVVGTHFTNSMFLLSPFQSSCPNLSEDVVSFQVIETVLKADPFTDIKIEFPFLVFS